MAKTAVGIDIGHDTLRVVSLVPSGKFKLAGLNTVNIPPGSWTQDALQNIDQIAKALDMALFSAKPHKITSRIARFALPERVVFSGSMTVANNPKEMKTSVPLQASDKLSIDLDQYYLDWEITESQICFPDEQKFKDKKEVTVFVIAAKKTLIDSLVELSEMAKIEIASINVKPSAIALSVLSANDSISRVIMDLGVSSTGIAILRGRSLALISTVPIGTKDYIQSPTDNAFIVKPRITAIFDEVVHAIKFYENRLCPSQKVDEIVLAGNGANLEHCEEIFRHEVGLLTVVGNPFERVDTRHFPLPKDLSRTLADAVGLAMATDD